MFEHRRGDFGTSGPLTASIPGMSLAFIQVGGIRLDHMAAFQKQQPRLLGGHLPNEGFGLIEGAAQAAHDAFRVQRLTRHEFGPFCFGVV